MLSKISLRARLTILSAIVMVSVAIALTAVFIVSADQIFVQGVQNELDNVITFQTTPLFEQDSGLSITPSGDWGKDEEDELVDYSVIRMTLHRAGFRFNRWGVAGLILITLIGTGATWLVVGRALKPVRELSDAIEEIGGNDLSRRVDAHGSRDEIGHLAQSFNAMMDKVSESFERQKRFSASAAHELKTPLATIQVGMEVLHLDDNPDPERMKKTLAVAKSNTDRMIRLVEDLFRLSTDETYRMDEDISVSHLFTELIRELSPAVREKDLITSVSAEEGIRLRGNRTLLYRALFNLAENAVKYNREGGEISLSACLEKDGVTLCISDTGIGIEPEEKERIFEPFYRIDRSRSRAMGGSGLGLSLAQDIIKKHGGIIEVDSTPGKGTSFIVIFPVADSITRCGTFCQTIS